MYNVVNTSIVFFFGVANLGRNFHNLRRNGAVQDKVPNEHRGLGYIGFVFILL